MTEYEIDMLVTELINHSSRLYKSYIYSFREWAEHWKKGGSLDVAAEELAAKWWNASWSFATPLMHHRQFNAHTHSSTSPEWRSVCAELYDHYDGEVLPGIPNPFKEVVKPQPKYPPGTRVRVSNANLKSYGMTGTVRDCNALEYDGSRLYSVELENAPESWAKYTSYKEINLEPAPEPKFKPGDYVKVCSSGNEFHGCFGYVVRPGPNSCTWWVQFNPGAGTVNFEEDQLKRATRAAERFNNAVSRTTAADYVAVDVEAHPPQFQSATPQPQENTMDVNTKTIEQRTFILGVDATTKTDEQLYEALHLLNNEVKRLESTPTPPQKLLARIEVLKAGMQQISEYIDARDQT